MLLWSFVARAYAGDIEQSKEIIKEAISHKGFALGDVFHPCVSFNKVNTDSWFKAHTYYLEDSHDPLSRLSAFQKATEKERLPLGIFYKNPEKPTFEENVGLYKKDKTPLSLRKKERGERLMSLILSKK